MNKRSAFSIEHDWRLIPSEYGENPGHAPIHSLVEKAAIRAIGEIGIIGSVQMSRLFGFKRHHLRRMIAEKKLVQHRLIKNKNEIPAFTIGSRGAQFLNTKPSRPESWTTEQIVRSLVFFQFCCALREKQKDFDIEPAPQPFTGSVAIGGQRRYVLVIRRKMGDIRKQLRHNTYPIIVIAESLDLIQGYEGWDEQARLLLDEDLSGDYRFYRYINEKWLR